MLPGFVPRPPPPALVVHCNGWWRPGNKANLLPALVCLYIKNTYTCFKKAVFLCTVGSWTTYSRQLLNEMLQQRLLTNSSLHIAALDITSSLSSRWYLL